MSVPEQDPYGGDPFGGMDEPCPLCGRPVGDHTMREFTACQVARGVADDRPYHEVAPENKVMAVMEGVRSNFGIGGDVLIADHVDTAAMVLAGDDRGVLSVRSPAVQLHFRVGLPTGPAHVAKVLYIAPTPTDIRALGKLVHDTANGAANAALRARADKNWRPGK